MAGQYKDEPLQIMELFKNRLCFDSFWDESAPLEERAGVTEDDLPSFNFDFEEQWAKINAEMNDKVEDYSELFSEIVEANKEVAISEMGIHVEEEDILDGLFNEDALMIPPMETVKDKIEATDSIRKRNENTENHGKEGPSLKKIKGGGKRYSSHDTQFVFVNDLATNEKKVITLLKGEKLPAGYEMASIQGDLPPLPHELSFLPLPKLQDLITNNTSPSKDQTTISASSTSTKDSPKSTRLNSLSDLMTSEMQRKSRLKYKQRSGTNPSRIASIMNNTAPSSGQANLVPQQPSLEISPVTSLHLEVGKTNFSVKRLPLPQAKPVQTRGIPIIRSSPQPVGVATTQIQQKPSLSVLPLPLGQNLNTSAKQTRSALICKLCGEIFLLHMDHLFRKHMFAVHDVEIADENQCFEESKVASSQFLRCKKCKAVVPNKYEEHKMRCLPSVPKKEAWEEINMSAFPTGHHACGIRECRLVFKSRYLLHNHLKKEHKAYANKMILDPHFRCSQCLKRFDDSYALGMHCSTCTEMRPRNETIIELIKGILDCDLCGEKHEDLGLATSCYINKSIFRCVLCLAVIKNRKNIYKHLHDYHGLQLTNDPKLTMDCPICDVKADKYHIMCSHIVTEHYTTVFTNNPGAFAPSPSLSQTAQVVQQKQLQNRASDGSARRPDTKVTSTSTSTSGGNTIVAKKLPELNPLQSGAAIGIGVPPGIRINTNRLSPLVASGDVLMVSSEQSRAGPVMMRNPQSSLTYPQNKIVLYHNPNPSSLSATPKGPMPISINLQNFVQSGVAPGTRTMLVNPSNTAQIPDREISAAIRQPMSGLVKTGGPSATRQPQVQLVRPLPTSAPLIIRPNNYTTTTSQMRTSTGPSSVSNNTLAVTQVAGHLAPGQLVVSSRPVTSPPGQLHGITNVANTNTTNASSTAVNIVATTGTPPLSTSGNFIGPIGSGEFTITQSTIRGASMVSVRPPPISTSTLTTSASVTKRPSVVTTASGATGLTTPVSASASTINKITTGNNASSNSTTTTTAMSKPNTVIVPAPPKPKPASRIVTIGGRTFEYQVIQNKLANKSHAVTQSASGVTSVRHTVPFPSNFKIPALPCTGSMRLVGPSSADQKEKPKDGNGKPSQNSQSSTRTD